MAEDPEESNVTKLNIQKNKLELHIQEFKSLVDELEKTSNHDTDEKEFEELDKMKVDAQMALIELKNKIDVLNGELEKEEKLRHEQLEKEERLRREQLEIELKRDQEEKDRELKREQLDKDREHALKLEEMKLWVEMEKLRTEQLKVDADTKTKEMETEKELKIAERRSSVEPVMRTSNPANVRLPKFELMKFDGDIFKWQEFWDCFNTAIHEKELSRIDKFNYLRSLLRNDVKEVLSGLETTDANYGTAIEFLQERYGKKQLIIHAHYAKLKEMPQSSNYYEKLRVTFDSIEKHLLSLKALGENIENT